MEKYTSTTILPYSYRYWFMVLWCTTSDESEPRSAMYVPFLPLYTSLHFLYILHCTLFYQGAVHRISERQRESHPIKPTCYNHTSHSQLPTSNFHFLKRRGPVRRRLSIRRPGGFLRASLFLHEKNKNSLPWDF